MLDRILNNGVTPGNADLLNRKIRISNLIALISVVVIGLYTPLYFYYSQAAAITVNLSFWAVSAFTFFVLHRRKYLLAFYLHCSAGYLYFIAGTLLYGVSTNLHFYLLVMCMIVAVLFDKTSIIRLYLAIAVVAFFALVMWSYNYPPLVDVPADLQTIGLVIGNVNIFLLFCILSLFILFFKNGLLRSQQNVLKQKEEIEEKNRDITDSIQYARRIQSALLPGKENLQKMFPGSFLYFRPKDIVSGDFYWFYRNGDFRFLVVGDCTGHGVPGALMSVLGINLLSEIVENKKLTDPGEILDELRNGIVRAFDKEGRSSEYKDGMDISLLRISEIDRSYSFAAANNPVYLIRSGKLTELKPDKQPVGFSHNPKPFTTQAGNYEPGDVFVLFTDGYADQFGGPRNKKFMYRPFKELFQHRQADMENLLHATFEGWRGENEQVDDICIAGIKMS